MVYLTFGVIVVVSWFVGTCVYNVFFHPLKAIPGPFMAKISRWWIFDLEMRGNPHVEILELHRKYGPMLRISPNEISLNDPEASSIVYGQTSKFEKSQYFYHQAPNLFTIRDRQQHAKDKSLISHAFSRTNIIQHQGSIFDKGHYLMNRFIQSAKDGQIIPLFPAFRCMTLDTISEFAFGKSAGALQLGDYKSPIFEAIDKATHSVPFFQHFPILRELIRWASYYNLSAVPNGFLELAQISESGFQQMHTTETWTMFKNMVLAAEKKSRELTKEHLISEAIVMFVAGTDTTAAALAVTLHHLLQQPDIYRRLQDEVRTVMPTPDSRPTVPELEALPFLNACVKEGLRISCPSRTRLPGLSLLVDGVLEDITYQLGQVLSLHFPWSQTDPLQTEVSATPLYALHDEVMFPAPTTYTPTRWLADEDQKREMSAYFHPFSRGTRQCVGQT
ncbi:cytochrome P450 [Aspergillus campestris IBT 28561]|uniref:Cytochrome P450 n=1 Tax=Aspergillus campestris (strain IBT 28561) TaxID=1392248 RepID=A0A2I1D735_ASPC2|nr:cytochrome P450 [Aspergillus campestris IBT 28561]PKY05677.1 cytochrome P450 [Aspergillus campestris IBT 28561]